MAAALRHPVYDRLYLALAEAEEATVVTLDRRFVGVVAASPLQKRVMHLEDPDLS